MAKATCPLIEDGKRCGLPLCARGWCKKHYYRWRNHGDPLKVLRRRVRVGYSIRNGYVILYRPDHPVADSKGYVAEHRMVAYDAGLLTDLSLHVHHRNGDRANNSLTNLEVLSLSEHARLHNHPGAWERAKTHCPQGHPYDDENTYRPPGRPNSRNCRACMADRSKNRSR